MIAEQSTLRGQTISHGVKRRAAEVGPSFPGQLGDDLPIGTWRSVLMQAGLPKYRIVVEKSPKNYAEFSPDIPGCVATADTPDELRLDDSGGD